MPTGFQELKAGRGFAGRLETGTDLIEEIERFCAEQGVVAAQVTVIGAVRRAAFAFYEQDDHRYLELSSDTHHEIVGFTGNISLRDDRPFLHAHATFADATGAAVGGHLRAWVRGVRRRGDDPRDHRRRARAPSGSGHGAGAVVRHSTGQDVWGMAPWSPALGCCAQSLAPGNP